VKQPSINICIMNKIDIWSEITRYLSFHSHDFLLT